MVAEERDDGAFDPRYDPSFQRGYQPQPGERPRTRVRTDAPDSAYRRPSSLLDAGTRPPAEPRPEQRDYDYAVVRASDMVAPTADAVDALPAAMEPEPALVVAAPGVLDRLEVNPKRNPLILTLWIVGAGFVVLGIVLYCISVTASYSGPTPSSDVGSLVFAQLGWMLAGPLITVGLLTLVGLLFLTALAGRRTRDAVAPDEEL